MSTEITGDNGETIPGFLRRMIQKALGKGEDRACGFKDTREIADFFGIPLARARRHLNRLYADGVLEAFEGRGCHAACWTVANYESVTVDGSIYDYRQSPAPLPPLVATLEDGEFGDEPFLVTLGGYRLISMRDKPTAEQLVERLNAHLDKALGVDPLTNAILGVLSYRGNGREAAASLVEGLRLTYLGEAAVD